MKGRVVLGCVFCVFLIALGHGTARASIFCDADIAGVAAVETPRPENPRVPQPRVALILDSNAPGALSGDIVLLTDDTAYDVNFSGVLAAKNAADMSGITKPLLIGFPKPLTVRYAWVDQIGIDGAAPHSCPTNPFELGGSNDATEAISLPSGPLMPNAFQIVPAAFKMNLPALGCTEPYREPKLTKWVEEKTDVLDTSAGLKANARVRVFLDSDGKVAYANISKSSGSPAVDNAAVSAAAKALYQPAIFRCTAVVSSLLVDVGYEVLH